MSERRCFDFDGHELAYRVSGYGPAVVVINLYRRPQDLLQARLLANGWKAFQIAPLGYGYSERVPGYAGDALADQVLAVLDHEGVERFVIWGYSAGAAMAGCVARATPRTAGLVAGGYSFLGFPSDALMRQLDRRLRPDHPSWTLWRWVRQFDWAKELKAMPFPRLHYWGSEDRQMARPLRAARQILDGAGVEFIEFPGLDHGGFSEKATADSVVPVIAEWAARNIGPLG